MGENVWKDTAQNLKLRHGAMMSRIKAFGLDTSDSRERDMYDI